MGDNQNLATDFLPLAAFALAGVYACGNRDRIHDSGFSGSDSIASDSPSQYLPQKTLAEIAEEVREFSDYGDASQVLVNLLKSQLIESLSEIHSGRIPASSPLGAANRITDLAFDPETHVLSWSYRNLGDYNLSGEVNVADIVKIAQLFQVKPAEAGIGEEFSRWVDGDSSGEIGIPDVTPIAQYYLSSVSGYSVQAAETADGPWSDFYFVPMNFEPVVEPYPEEGVFPIIVSIEASAVVGKFVRVVPIGKNEEAGEPGDILWADGKPIISSAGPLASVSGSPVIFQATVNGTEPMIFHWNFGGAADVETSNLRTPSVRISEPGTYSVSLTVTNSLGSDEFTFEFKASESEEVPIIISLPDVTGVPFKQITLKPGVRGKRPMEFHWNFGAAGTPAASTDENPVVTLNNIGVYDCSLRIRNEFGEDFRSFKITVRGVFDESVLPKAVLEIFPEYGVIPFTIYMDGGKSTGKQPLTYLWKTKYDYGFTLNTGTKSFAQYTFEEDTWANSDRDGNLRIELIVTDADGTETIDSKTIYVNARPHFLSNITSNIYARPGVAFTISATASDNSDYVEKYEWDMDNDGVFEIDNGSNTTLSYTYEQEGIFPVKLRAVDNHGLGTEMDFSVNVKTNHLPIAQAMCNAPVGNAPHYTRIGFGEAYDRDGYLTLFEFDADNDGVFEFVSSNSYWAYHTYEEPGEYRAFIRLTDNDGGTIEEYFDISVFDNWQIAEFQIVNSMPVRPSIGTIGGRAAICYWNSDTQSLMFMRADASDWFDWSAPVEVTQTDAFGRSFALAEIDGKPVVAYTDFFDMYYVAANDEDGSSWNEPINVDVSPYVGVLDISIADVAGWPAISFTETQYRKTCYIRALNSNGTTWAPATIAENTAYTQAYDMKNISGVPAIVKTDSSSHLGIALAKDEFGSEWPDAPIEFLPHLGHSPSLTMVAGHPAIVFGLRYPAPNAELGYIRALDERGDQWPTSITTMGFVYNFTFDQTDNCTLAAIGSVPAVAFRNNYDRDLKYVEALDLNGSEWGKTVTIDSIGNTGGLAQLLEFSGRPAIIYYDYTRSALKIAIRKS